MGLQGPFSVDFGTTFPFGLVMASSISPLNDFDQSTRENPVQAYDRDSGLRMWQFDVIDLDPEARERTFKVKIAAEHQPVPPDAIQGLPLRPVVLEGLMVTPWIKEGRFPKVAYSVRCTGISAPKGAAASSSKAA